MRNNKKIHFLVIVYIIIGLISCSSDENNPSSKKKSPDTRALVKQAHDNIDPNNIDYTLNLERAKIYCEKSEESSSSEKINLILQCGLELLNGGETEKGIDQLLLVEEMYNSLTQKDEKTIIFIKSALAIGYLRLGELENCIQYHNHNSCIVPIVEEGIHKLKFGSSNAIEKLKEVLEIDPKHQQSIWLLNLAYMTLGEFPQKVPKAFLLDPSYFNTDHGLINRFENIASNIGIDDNRLSGSVIIEDFDKDGDYDIFTSSWGLNDRVYFYENQNGKFVENGLSRGLEGHVGGLNLKQTDFNNDGWLDVYIMRGAWMGVDGAIPNTLLKNNGDGTFKDITLEAGLTTNSPTQSASWNDFNKDGWLDLIVVNESFKGNEYPIQLWINQKDGSFKDQAIICGLNNNGYLKGVSVGDINNDSWPDIYISNLSGNNFLYIHTGLTDEILPKFVDYAPSLNMVEPQNSFPNLIFDFNNDGNNDIFVSSYAGDIDNPAAEFSLNVQGKSVGGQSVLYRNNGNGTFTNISNEIGLTESTYTMGCNFGDINNDGWLDFYLGTGKPSFFSVIPNKMYLNNNGISLSDISYEGGFAHIQKGHGISMTDLDQDGNLDVYAVMGGAYQGDGFQNALFMNPGNENHWVIFKLEGVSANKAAIGTRLKVSITENGKARDIFRSISSGASFGSNSLDCHIGIGSASKIDKVEIYWPNQANSVTTLHNLNVDKKYYIKEGTEEIEEMSYKTINFQSSNHK